MISPEIQDFPSSSPSSGYLSQYMISPEIQDFPSSSPSSRPTTRTPTEAESAAPSDSPSETPSDAPSAAPSTAPSEEEEVVCDGVAMGDACVPFALLAVVFIGLSVLCCCVVFLACAAKRLRKRVKDVEGRAAVAQHVAAVEEDAARHRTCGVGLDQVAGAVLTAAWTGGAGSQNREPHAMPPPALVTQGTQPGSIVDAVCRGGKGSHESAGRGEAYERPIRAVSQTGYSRLGGLVAGWSAASGGEGVKEWRR